MTRVLIALADQPFDTVDVGFVAAKTLFTAEAEFEKQAGGITSLEADLLRLASAIFAADRAIERGEGEDLARTIELQVPVVNAGQLAPLRSILENLLYKLSQDAWCITFQQISGEPEKTKPPKPGDGRTLLFSGGADSLAAAIEYGRGSHLELVSHRTRNAATDHAQRELVKFLNAKGYDLPHVQFFISSRTATGSKTRHDEEESQRTRSFVFLTIGALAGRRSGNSEVIFLAENGQMAVHLPLTQGRIGALSTHTAHPDVLRLSQDFLSAAMAYDVQIVNPYVYDTKAEVVARILASLPDALWLSNSCWRNARLANATHCGECVPCLVRRIAIEYKIVDKTVYARDPFSEDLAGAAPDDVARRNLADLGEFVTRFRRYKDEEILSEWPELFSDAMDASKVIGMYRRFAGEAVQVLQKYPLMQFFIK